MLCYWKEKDRDWNIAFFAEYKEIRIGNRRVLKALRIPWNTRYPANFKKAVNQLQKVSKDKRTHYILMSVPH